MENLSGLIFGYDKESKRAYFSVDGYSFFVSADNVKAAWKVAYTCYRAEKNPIQYLHMRFYEV
jgi:hypothetical protein